MGWGSGRGREVGKPVRCLWITPRSWVFLGLCICAVLRGVIFEWIRRLITYLPLMLNSARVGPLTRFQSNGLQSWAVVFSCGTNSTSSLFLVGLRRECCPQLVYWFVNSPRQTVSMQDQRWVTWSSVTFLSLKWLFASGKGMTGWHSRYWHTLHLLLLFPVVHVTTHETKAWTNLVEAYASTNNSCYRLCLNWSYESVLSLGLPTLLTMRVHTLNSVALFHADFCRPFHSSILSPTFQNHECISSLYSFATIKKGMRVSCHTTFLCRLLVETTQPSNTTKGGQ